MVGGVFKTTFETFIFRNNELCFILNQYCKVQITKFIRCHFYFFHPAMFGLRPCWTLSLFDLKTYRFARIFTYFFTNCNKKLIVSLSNISTIFKERVLFLCLIYDIWRKSSNSGDIWRLVSVQYKCCDPSFIPSIQKWIYHNCLKKSAIVHRCRLRPLFLEAVRTVGQQGGGCWGPFGQARLLWKILISVAHELCI